ncbi:MAG: TlpA disulfide reductase family protein [Rhodocyclaceae bacterium]|nr:TlpA disulfide reductase family protein [Rhodocyclaceae bacterium]MDZ4216635.1 TlpA disulfide reductase family protein [Rhodocyclaceae bacterium]
MKHFLCALLLAAIAPIAAAGELRPFTTDTLAEIRSQHAGRPFMLTLWSLTCHHCAKELRMLGKLAAKGSKLPLAIVSTDTPHDEQDIRAALKRFDLDHLDTWVFADPIPERLRHAIDPTWRGELPKSYLYDATHRPEAHSGALDESTLRKFLQSKGGTR